MPGALTGRPGAWALGLPSGRGLGRDVKQREGCPRAPREKARRRGGVFQEVGGARGPRPRPAKGGGSPRRLWGRLAAEGPAPGRGKGRRAGSERRREPGAAGPEQPPDLRPGCRGPPDAGGRSGATHTRSGRQTEQQGSKAQSLDPKEGLGGLGCMLTAGSKPLRWGE